LTRGSSGWSRSLRNGEDVMGARGKDFVVAQEFGGLQEEVGRNW